MPQCSRCKTSEDIQKGLFKDVPFSQTPCSACTLTESSMGTFELKEGHISNSSRDESPDDDEWTREAADEQTPPPYSRIAGEDSESQYFPVSTLVSAMGLFLSLSLPARKSLQLRMQNIPYSQIAQRLGCTRQAVEKLLAQALAKEPLLQNLLPAKTARTPTTLSGSRTSAIADYDKSAKKRITVSRKPHFVANNETRTA